MNITITPSLKHSLIVMANYASQNNSTGFTEAEMVQRSQENKVHELAAFKLICAQIDPEFTPTERPEHRWYKGHDIGYKIWQLTQPYMW